MSKRIVSTGPGAATGCQHYSASLLHLGPELFLGRVVLEDVHVAAGRRARASAPVHSKDFWEKARGCTSKILESGCGHMAHCDWEPTNCVV